MGKYSLMLGLVGVVLGCASSRAQTGVSATPNGVAPQLPVAAIPASQAPSDATANAETKDTRPADTGESADAEAMEGPDAQALYAALPAACEDGVQCIPPREFAAATCRGRYPSMAISMFGKQTPWQRLYVKVATVDPVNAYGERSKSEPLIFGEEVIVLRGISQPKAGSLLVSTTDIDVLRWDGTCVTVERGAFSSTRMATLVQAMIDWRRLEDPFQEALLASKSISASYEKHRTLCRGSRTSTMDPQCRKAAERLSDSIGMAVRAGLALPIPIKLPSWTSPENKTSQTVAMRMRRRD